MSRDLPVRLPWPPDFPEVIVHTAVATRDAHPQYLAAKSGDAMAALLLAGALLSSAAVAQIGRILGSRSATFLPVVADEQMGFNAIPDALAQLLGFRLGCPVAAGQIVQSNMVGHTRAPAFQRFVTPATFDGPVETDTNYILVDDHVGLGGTLANLRGYVEARGGRVIAMTTLTESREARSISLQKSTQAMLWDKHGQALDLFWRQQFGHGIDCLTEIEAQNLCRQPSLARIEDFLAQAAIEARGRGLKTTAGRFG